MQGRRAILAMLHGSWIYVQVCRLTNSTDAKTRASAIQALTEMGERGACFSEEAWGSKGRWFVSRTGKEVVDRWMGSMSWTHHGSSIYI